jgi:integrase/recombinase XerC
MKIKEAIHAYIQSVTMARSEHTARAYQNSMRLFQQLLAEHNLSPGKDEIDLLPEEAIIWLSGSLKGYAPATEQLYLQAAKGFYEYLAAEGLTSPNLPRIRLLIRQRSRRPGVRLPQFPRNNIENILEYANNLVVAPTEDPNEQLRNLRDRAFLLTLSDTGLRVHEACELRRGDIDWNEGRATVIGKGNREAVVRFSARALAALKDYLAARAKLDGASGRALTALPLFARHDKGAGKKTKPITTATGRNIVTQRVGEALGTDAVGSITPHSFRHYFVTTVLRASGNLKLAQELARHKNIAITQRYAHLNDDELDQGYWEIFNDQK